MPPLVTSAPVDNDDVVSTLLKFKSGCQGIFSAKPVWPSAWEIRFLCWFRDEGHPSIYYRRSEYQISQSDGHAGFVTVPNRPVIIMPLAPCPLCEFFAAGSHVGVAVGYASFGFMILGFFPPHPGRP